MALYEPILTRLFDPLNRPSKTEVEGLVSSHISFFDSSKLYRDKDFFVSFLLEFPLMFYWVPTTLGVVGDKAYFSIKSLVTGRFFTVEVIWSADNKIRTFNIQESRHQYIDPKWVLLGLALAFGAYKILLN